MGWQGKASVDSHGRNRPFQRGVLRLESHRLRPSANGHSEPAGAFDILPALKGVDSAHVPRLSSASPNPALNDGIARKLLFRPDHGKRLESRLGPEERGGLMKSHPPPQSGCMRVKAASKEQACCHQKLTRE